MPSISEDTDEYKASKAVEDKNLLDKISEISGRINRHKNLVSAQSEDGHTQPWNKHTSHIASDSWRSPRTAPYPRGRGRHTTHRNRTLVLNGSGNTSSAEENPHKKGDTQSEPATGWIAKRDRHMQLINPSVYGKETQNRSQAMAETRRQKALQRDQKEKQKIQKHFHTRDAQPGPTLTTPVVHELDIDGLRFQVLNGGSKLARTYNDSTNNKDDDVVSDQDDEMNSDDMDSDGLEEIMGTDSWDEAASHAMSQQQDYVGF
ncbi:MAG: hypothetical protein Q9164_001386 [Protoblastenia rupestris]